MLTGKRSLVSVISVGLALILSLAGCSGGKGAEEATPATDEEVAAEVAEEPGEEAAEEAEDLSTDFVGTWSLIGAEGVEDISQEDLEQMKELGATITLTLDEDGAAVLELAGEYLEGTWEAKTSTTGVFVIDDARHQMELKDETLTLSNPDGAMIFERAGA